VKTLTARRWLDVILLLLVLLLMTLRVGIEFGPSPIGGGRLSFWEARAVTVSALLGREPGTMVEDIICRIRLPRLLLAAAVGAGLAIAGGTFQAMLRNPLADPFILGVSGGATVGAVVAMLFRPFLRALAMPAAPIFAFGGALGTMLLVYWVAQTRGRLQPYVLLMVGVIVNAVLGAVIMFLMTVARLPELQQITYWLMGGIRDYGGYAQIGLTAAFVAAGGAVLVWRASEFNLLSLGEESAQQLGVNAERTKLIGFVGASIVVGAVVSMSGPIGFVGLIVPHLVRLIWGPDHRLLLPACLLAGAIFLAVCDTAARVMTIPVGVVTAFCGGPFFLVLLKRQQRRAGGAG